MKVRRNMQMVYQNPFLLLNPKINLMIKIQSDYSLTYLFISHDLSVIKHVSHHIALMYAGQLVELSKNKELFANPFHPYTEALLSAIAIPDPERKRKNIVLKGQVPNLVNQPSGCRSILGAQCKWAYMPER